MKQHTSTGWGCLSLFKILLAFMVGNTRLLILLPLESRQVVPDNTVVLMLKPGPGCSQRKKSSLTSRYIVNRKISGGIKGLSSLIKFVKVLFTVNLACSSKRCLSHSAGSNLDNVSLLSLLFLVCWFSYFVEFPSDKLALLAHPNRGYS